MTQNEMIEKYYPNITRLVIAEARRWRVDPDDLEDMVTKTIIRLLRYPVNFAGARDEDALFFASVKRACQQVLYGYRGFRGNGKVTGVSQAKRETFSAGLFQNLERDGADNVLDERMLPLMPSAEDAYFKSTRFDALWAAVDGLSELQRTCVSLRYQEELSVADIALKMCITEQKVNWTIAEALRKLRKRMNPGKTSYPSAKLNENRKVKVGA